MSNSESKESSVKMRSKAKSSMKTHNKTAVKKDHSRGSSEYLSLKKEASSSKMDRSMLDRMSQMN